MQAYRWLAALVLGLGLSVAVMAQDKITLKVNYEPGTYLLTSKTQTATSMTGDMKMSSSMIMTMITEMEVAKADDKGNREVKSSFKQIKMEQTVGNTTCNYDSAIGDNGKIGPIGNAFGAMIGKTITLTLDSKGGACNIRGVEEMVAAMMKNSGLPASAEAALKNQFGQKMVEETFSNLQAFPDKPVAKGDTWDIIKKMELKVVGATDFKQTNTLKDVKNKNAIIAFTGTLKKPKTTTSGPAGQTATIQDLSITQNGTSQVIIDTGMVKQTDMAQRGSFTVIAGEGDSKKEMKFTLDTVGTVTIEKGMYKAPTTAKAEK